MKDTTKKNLILGVLVVAVCSLIAIKRVYVYQTASELADDSIIGKGKPVLLELGSHGCRPCDAMFPILTELSKEQGDFEVSFVDVKAVEGKYQQYNIDLIPVQIFFDAEGAELFRHVGFYAKEDILAKWQELFTGEPKTTSEKILDESNGVPSKGETCI